MSAIHLPIDAAQTHYHPLEKNQDIAVIIFKFVLNGETSLKMSVNYELVSKKIRAYVIEARNHLFVERLINFPSASSLTQDVKGFSEKSAALRQWCIQDLPGNNKGNILHQTIRDVLDGKEDLAQIERLLKAGFNPNKANKAQPPLCTALSYIDQQNSKKNNLILEIATLLIAHGADPNGCEKNPPLLAVLQYIPCEEEFKAFQIQIVTLLYQHGADAEKKYVSSLSKNPISALDRASGFLPHVETVLLSNKSFLTQIKYKLFH